ncbi:glutamine amidotransferase [Naasia aerilata]|uniref:Glutamine amidotransferase n=1 Tax=Naasia aerilata TaxID=1162966 RepID=A0ABM8GD41_9MICO|nr:glutamine amidotransferase [Naasia aerilata]BDZ46190.1 glutamine amidotransferase [Naasia aerilata]
MKPFLLLASRPEDAAADGEYEAVLRFAGLRRTELRRVRLEQRPLGELRLADYSGLIMGGSPFNSSDPVEAKSEIQRRVEAELSNLLDAVVAADFPMLGACYGVGTIGTHEGAVVDRTYSEPVGPVAVTLTAAGRSDPLFGVLPLEFEAFVGHKEAVRELPPHAVRLASSAACPVQAFRVGSNVYATQFHPELDVDGIVTRIDVYKNAGYFPPEEAEKIKERVRSSAVRHPPAVLRRFVERYAVPA